MLIYLLLADRRVEIVADRGIEAQVERAEWQAICRMMERHFRDGRFEEGARRRRGRGLRAARAPISPRAKARNELPDRPVLI